MYRDVLLLALCQALLMTGTSLLITSSALVGRMLTPLPALTTLPLALQFLTTMLTAFPAALLMKRVGRRAGVMSGALLAGMVSYGVMKLVMTATPLAMADCGLPFDDTAFVIQWHVVAMFLPAFFTGHLIRRFGVLTVMGVGALQQRFGWLAVNAGVLPAVALALAAVLWLGRRRRLSPAAA